MEEFSVDVNKIAAETIASLSKSAAGTVAARVKKATRDAIARSSIDFGLAFSKYLTASKERCEKVKTLLYKQEPQSLYSFYVSTGVMRRDKVFDTSDIHQILRIGHKLIVSGTGGIGKTIMLKYFFVDCVKKTDLIPILVELRGLNELQSHEITLADYIYENLRMYNFDLEEEYFRYSLETGCYLILLDGFDEVKNEVAGKVSREINALSTKYSDNYYIVSSRPSEEFIGWNDFVELDALPMTKSQALELVEKLDYDKAVKDKFYAALDSDLFENYESFASNPLLLTIMLITFDSQAAIPEKLNDFYEQAFSAMFSRHDATKCGYQRDIASKLSYEDFKSVFSYFCFKSYFKSQFEFTPAQAVELIGLAQEKLKLATPFQAQDYLSDLTGSVCMLLHEGQHYKFAHRSFQEYFAALYTTQLDDDTQRKLLTAWLKEGHRSSFSNSGYLYMLYDLQKERFVKNVLRPGLLKLKRRYENFGRDAGWLMGELYEEVMVYDPDLDELMENDDDAEDRPSASLFVTVKNSYYNTLIETACSILGVEYMDFLPRYRNLEREVAERLRTMHFDGLPFSQLKREHLDLYTEVITALSPHRDLFEAALGLVEQYDRASGGGRKVDALLDAL